jgi:hypothetical protein
MSYDEARKVHDPESELEESDLAAVAGGHTLVQEADCGGSGTFQTANSFEASIGALGGGGADPVAAAVAPAPVAQSGSGRGHHGHH